MMATEERTLAERWETVEDVPKVCATCGVEWRGKVARFILEATPEGERVEGVCYDCADKQDAEARRFAKTFQGVEMVKGSTEELKVQEEPDIEQEMLNLNGMPDMTQ